jgi:hypothetical protein
MLGDNDYLNGNDNLFKWHGYVEFADSVTLWGNRIWALILLIGFITSIGLLYYVG